MDSHMALKILNYNCMHQCLYILKNSSKESLCSNICIEKYHLYNMIKLAKLYYIMLVVITT